MTFNPFSCFGMSLRRGALVVAAMTIIISFARVAFISTALNWNLHLSQGGNGKLFFNVTPVMRDLGGLMSTNADISVLNVYIIMAIQLLLNLMNIVFGMMLVHGVRQERPCLIKANLIFSGAFFTLSLAVIGLSLIIGIKISIEVIVYEVILHFLYLYFILVIYFVYVDIRDGRHTINGDNTSQKSN